MSKSGTVTIQLSDYEKLVEENKKLKDKMGMIKSSSHFGDYTEYYTQKDILEVIEKKLKDEYDYSLKTKETAHNIAIDGLKSKSINNYHIIGFKIKKRGK